MSVFNLNLDLLELEAFVEELDVPDLVSRSRSVCDCRQCFTAVHQLFSLLLSGQLTDILDDEVRSEQYPFVAIPVEQDEGCEV